MSNRNPAALALATALLTGLALLAAPTGASAAPERGASAAPERGASAAPERRALERVTFTTVGWGHGKGLSQYGARNRAEAGQSWRAIVRHYYPRTAWGRAGGKIRIKITADTSRDVVVKPRSGLRVRSLGADRTWRLPAKVRGAKVRAWRITPAGQKSAVSYRTKGWHRWRTARGQAEFSAGGAPVVLVTPSGRAAYRGALRSTIVDGTGRARATVNVVSLETYLRGVVPQEVPASWPAAAVRAQTVAARTYAAFERRDNRRDAYDLCDTAACQVYGGVAAEHPRSDAAIRATRRTVATYGGRPIFAQFSASNGGWSINGGFPYLRAKQDRFDKGAPGDPTRTTFAASAITRNWPGIGDLVSIRVTEADGRGALDGRVTQVRVEGTNFTATVSGSQLAGWLGLRSTMFRIS